MQKSKQREFAKPKTIKPKKGDIVHLNFPWAARYVVQKIIKKKGTSDTAFLVGYDSNAKRFQSRPISSFEEWSTNNNVELDLGDGSKVCPSYWRVTEKSLSEGVSHGS